MSFKFKLDANLDAIQTCDNTVGYHDNNLMNVCGPFIRRNVPNIYHDHRVWNETDFISNIFWRSGI